MSTPVIAEIPLETCGRCRLPSPAPLLLPHVKSFHRGRTRICLNCVSAARRREDILLALAFILPLLLLPLPLIIPAFPPFLSFLVYLAFSVSLFLLTVVPLHEFAHFLVARMLGFKVPLLTFGAGDPLFICEFRVLSIVVGSWIGSGACWTVYPRGPAPLWKNVLVYAAGPLSNLVLAILVPVLLIPVASATHAALLTATLAIVFTGGNLAYFFASAIPRHSKSRPNDAAMILARFHWTNDDQRKSVVGSRCIEINAAFDRGDLHTARQILNEARTTNPEDPWLLQQDAALAAWECHWPHIQTILRPLLDRQPPSENHWMAVLYLLLADLHTAAPGDLNEAQTQGTQIIQALPRLPLALAAQAFCLCAQGRHDQAFPILARTAHFYAPAHTYAVIQHALALIHDHYRIPSQATRHRAWAAFYDPHGIITPQTIPPLFSSCPTVSN